MGIDNMSRKKIGLLPGQPDEKYCGNIKIM